MILSLQGCMAVGKTTAINHLKEHAKYVNISYEENSHIVKYIKEHGLNKNVYEDYIKIQTLWLENEIERFNKAKEYDCSIMDFGMEEIIFHTLSYPSTIGMNWDIENGMKDILDRARKCMPDRILFLSASDEELRRRKQNDPTRSRNSFESYLANFMPLKRAFFSSLDNVDYLDVDKLSADEVALKVKEWVDNILKKSID